MSKLKGLGLLKVAQLPRARLVPEQHHSLPIMIEDERRDQQAQALRLFIEAATFVARKGAVLHRPSHMDRFTRELAADTTHRKSLSGLWGNRFKKVNVVCMTLDEKNWRMGTLLRVRCFGFDNTKQHHFEAHLCSGYMTVHGLAEGQMPQETPWGARIFAQAEADGWKPAPAPEPTRNVWSAWRRSLGSMLAGMTGMRGV